METLIVRGAPEEYICEVGAWDKLEEHLIKRGITHCLVLHGKQSWEVANSFFPELKKVKTTFKHYQNECRFDIAETFKSFIIEEKIDGIVAVGGGKVLDLGKLIANELKIKSICLPTLASTCAAYTPVSIVYNEQHEMIDFKILEQAISLTLVAPEVIVNSPKEYLVAGIGDTLAKWYESDPVLSAIKNPSVELQVAQFAAKSCLDNLLTNSRKGLKDLEDGVLSYELTQIIETNILLAGMVGGFGDHYGRTSGAHSIHDGLTLVPGTDKYLHGNKVAYGILVQLAIEEKWEEINKLLPFYQELGLPSKYKDFGVTEKEMEIVANFSETDECMLLLPQEISATIIMDAIKQLEMI